MVTCPAEYICSVWSLEQKESSIVSIQQCSVLERNIVDWYYGTGIKSGEVAPREGRTYNELEAPV